MKKISIALLISLLVIYMSYEGARDRMLLKKGARLSDAKEYERANEIYDKLAGGTIGREALRNKVINLYRARRYEKVTEAEGKENFLRGNSYVYLADQSNGAMEENYKRALEEYKLAMKSSSDINIKKNYEIVMKKLKDHEQKQQENKEQNKDKSQQDKDQEEQQGQEKKDQKSEESQGDSSGDKEDPGDMKKDSSDSGEGSDTGGTISEKEGNEDLQRREAMTILEGLERNESQAFKNNERLERTLGGEEEDESW